MINFFGCLAKFLELNTFTWSVCYKISSLLEGQDIYLFHTAIRIICRRVYAVLQIEREDKGKLFLTFYLSFFLQMGHWFISILEELRLKHVLKTKGRALKIESSRRSCANRIPMLL